MIQENRCFALLLTGIGFELSLTERSKTAKANFGITLFSFLKQSRHQLFINNKIALTAES